MGRYDLSILKACEQLHMAHTGTLDPLSDDKSAELRAFLVVRRMDWDAPTSPYDQAVWDLMTAVLREYR